MIRPRDFTLAVTLACALLAGGPATDAAAQTKPEGEMRWALYVTLSPVWFDPAEVSGQLTPFWVLYALHDALVKPMPGNLMSPSLAESWTVSPDQRVYEFKLREGLKFHNGDPFTAEDVKFSFHRAKGSKVLRDKVREVVIVSPSRVRFVLHEPWPDFMTFYGTMVSGAGWVVPKKYVERVGDDGFKKAPVGLGPYKFVSHTPGVELVMEANEDYWRKVPSVKRLVYKSVLESTTRMAMLKRGEVDIAYLLDVPQAQEVKRDPNLKLAFSGGIGIFYLDFLDQWDPKSPWHDRRVRLAANYAIDRQALSDAETLGASKPAGNHVPRTFEFALPLEPYPYNPARAKQLLAEAGYPNGFDAGELHQLPPYFSLGEAIVQYMQAVGIRLKMRPMERGAYIALISSKKAKGLCVCSTALYGNAASRISEIIPSDGAYAYGGYPDIDALYKQQALETDRKKREVMLHQIQRLVYERVRYGPIYEYIWPSGIGPRVAEPALMLINPYPWSAPLEDVRLKKQ
ncbi:MAG TPA: ABC transporter substrate-binding protein [Methylomirabilota bacterium]|jgi:peptide/nickel transport system substrate-binding protein|nr:ABC transporter substrate-binding protein [Methylomirabilota bacterium]